MASGFNFKQWHLLCCAVERKVALSSYAPAIVDGERLHLRGERYLYCIAK